MDGLIVRIKNTINSNLCSLTGSYSEAALDRSFDKDQNAILIK